MTTDRTIIDEFENVLGIPFDPRWTDSISIDVPTARRLAETVSTFYRDFRLPEKKAGDMRPYLFPSFALGSKLWQNYVRFSGNEYSFTPTRDSDFLNLLKPFLLYSHGVCFLDPLPGLLDYFRLSPDESDFEKLRLPGVAHLLMEYVKIADLVRNRIVIPLSAEVFGRYSHNDFFLSDNERREVCNFLANAPHLHKVEEVGAIDLIGPLIKEQLWLNQRADNRIDLYFPHSSYIPILQGLFQAASYRYNSNELREPFSVGVFADIASLDTSQISIKDIVSIRSEHAFDDYRRILRGILQRLEDQEGNFSDMESEFAIAAREEMAECEDKIKLLTKKSNVLKDTLRNLDRILVGGACGSLGGILAGSPEIAVLGTAAGAAVRPLYDIVRSAWTNSPNSAVRASLRHHFLVLDPES